MKTPSICRRNLICKCCRSDDADGEAIRAWLSAEFGVKECPLQDVRGIIGDHKNRKKNSTKKNSTNKKESPKRGGCGCGRKKKIK